MVPVLLPASAAAFAPRATYVNVVLGSKVEPWLTQVLKRVSRIKRPLNNVAKHQKCLTDLLSSATAMWTITSLMVPKTPDFELQHDSNPLIEALLNYYFIHIDAYIVHVDMVFRNEVAFKLSSDSIKTLIDYHKNVYSINLSTNSSPCPEIEAQINQLHQDFIQDINKFVYRAHVTALENLQEDGSGELLSSQSEEVKNKIMKLFRPVTPPSSPEAETSMSQSVSPDCSDCSSLWSQLNYLSTLPEPTDTTPFISSSPETMSSIDSPSLWSVMDFNENQNASSISPFNQQYCIMMPEEQCGMNLDYGILDWSQYYDTMIS